MKADYTHILYLLDMSGSMARVASDVISGFNNFISKQKALSGECTLSLIQFDNKYQTDYNFAPMASVSKLKFEPRGMTALYDAIGKAITDTGKVLNDMPVFARPEKILVIVHTDGEENASKEFNKERIGEMIKHQEDKYNWKFSFIGTNFDVMGEGASLHIKAGNTRAYKNDSQGINVMYASLSNAVSNCRSVSAAAYANTNMFDANDDDKTNPTK
jgi:uncharacterized protein YegL